MRTVRRLALLLALGALALAGCGDDEDDSGSAPAPREPAATAPADEGGGKSKEQGGTEVKVGDSEFGDMLYGADDQAIYIFENDPEGETVCYDDCAEDWPPVYTDGKPVAGEGVDESLLGTVERRDGRKQVTYADKPLYFYANEEPGEVRCHNVNLNGGLWWVVGPDGKRRP